MRNKEILDSWKDISNYLNRDVRTCYRWEKELELPIHRIDKNSSRSKVFAYKSDIDGWLEEKAGHKEIRRKPLLKKRWPIVGLAFIVVIVLIVIAALYLPYKRYSPAIPENFSVAVLPFENSNFSEYEQYFPEGICNEIIKNLSRLNNLKIIPPTSFTQSNEAFKNLKDIGEKLNVDHVLKGKLEKNEDKLRIFIQLVRIEDDKIIWSLESEERLENAYTKLDDICLEIHKKLNPDADVGSFQLFKARKNLDYAAFDNYLKGNHILNKSNQDDKNPWKLYSRGKYYQGMWTQESNDLASDQFFRAIEIDKTMAEAYVGLARCYANNVNFNWDYDKEWLNKAEKLLQKARAILLECPEYYATLIQVYLLKYFCFDENTKNKASDLAQQAIKKYPGYSRINALLGSCYYYDFGEYGDESDLYKALEYKEESFLLNPFSLGNISFSQLLMLNGKFDKALIVCNKNKTDESSLMANFLEGEIYYYMGDFARSEEIFRTFESPLEYRMGSLFYLGMIASQRRDNDEVERILQKIKVIAPDELKLFGNDLKMASIYMGMENWELGYKHLEQFFKKEKAQKILYVYHKYIDMDKNFERVREEEKFKNIISTKGGMNKS